MQHYIKKITIIVSLLFLTGCQKYNNNKDLNIHFSSNNKDIEEDSINIICYYSKNNPGYKIINSYEIDDIKIMNEVIDVILDYNEENPNYDWDRNRISLLVEWILHNELYKINMMKDHTKDVDFNQKELRKLKDIF